MMVPAHDYRRTRIQTPDTLHQGLDGFVYGLVGRCKRVPSRSRSYRARAEVVSEQAMKWRNVSDRRLKDRLQALAERFRRVEKNLAVEVDEALALLVEAAHRTLGLRPFMVQIWGAMALNGGYLIENGHRRRQEPDRLSGRGPGRMERPALPYRDRQRLSGGPR